MGGQGRTYYDRLIVRLSEAGWKAFDAPGSARKIIPPWWDKAAGRMRSHVASVLLARSRCDALLLARPHQADRCWRRLLAMSSERHLPEPIAALLGDDRETDVPALGRRGAEKHPSVSAQGPKVQEQAPPHEEQLYTSRQREKGLAMSERAKRALRRPSGGTRLAWTRVLGVIRAIALKLPGWNGKQLPAPLAIEPT